ncbi:hypothetical protein ILYODFUR_034827 [Ilyodon furcidens]|uniref:Uncharacterized protein n=1 Tax=Ilyodon furcidens TaxID=33524 RepID=A0ABV0U413_9TELE
MKESSRNIFQSNEQTDCYKRGVEALKLLSNCAHCSLPATLVRSFFSSFSVQTISEKNLHYPSFRGSRGVPRTEPAFFISLLRIFKSLALVLPQEMMAEKNTLSTADL